MFKSTTYYLDPASLLISIWNSFLLELNECNSTDWNICDKNFAICKNLYAAYKCHCKTGYEDFFGNGAQCFGKWEFFYCKN